MIEVQRAERLQGLLAHAGEDRGRVPPRRLLHHRRPRPDRRAAAMSTIVGRGKDLIISGGYNVYPEGGRDARSTRCRAWWNPRSSACRTRISAKASPRWSSPSAGAALTRRRARGAGRAARRASSGRSGSCSSTTCRATPWARCRRTFSRRPTARPTHRQSNDPFLPCMGRAQCAKRTGVG